MSIISELEARGLLHDISDRPALEQLLSQGSISLYVGYDPTAPSLHIGNLVPTIMMSRLQKVGCRPIVLIGGATGMVGDPSGKSDERNLLDADTLAANVENTVGQLRRFFDFDCGANSAIMVDNAEWFASIRFLDFLRDIGKCLSVNYMMAKDSVRSRLENREQGISYTEFSYMLLQAYDFVHLAEVHQCRLQIGGSDQWGNITAGIELQRKLGRQPLYGLTGPLLVDAKGEKMGKTASGERIWLDPERTSPYAFYQYLLNTADADVERFLKIFSWKPVDEITELVAAHLAAPEQRLGQRSLAEEFTTWVHGADATRSAIAASQVMFGGSIENLTDSDLRPLMADVPSTSLSRDALAQGIALVDLMVETKLAQSKGAARRLLNGGGVYVNNIRVTDPAVVLTTADLGTESMMILRAGKKNYHIIALA